MRSFYKLIFLAFVALLTTFVSAQGGSINATLVTSTSLPGESGAPGGAGSGDFGGAAPDNATSTMDTTISQTAAATTTAVDPNSGSGAGGGAGTGDTGGAAPNASENAAAVVGGDSHGL